MDGYDDDDNHDKYLRMPDESECHIHTHTQNYMCGNMARFYGYNEMVLEEQTNTTTNYRNTNIIVSSSFFLVK